MGTLTILNTITIIIHVILFVTCLMEYASNPKGTLDWKVYLTWCGCLLLLVIWDAIVIAINLGSYQP